MSNLLPKGSSGSRGSTPFALLKDLDSSTSTSSSSPSFSSSWRKSCDSKQLSYIISITITIIIGVVLVQEVVDGGSVGTYFIYRRDLFALLTGTLKTFQKAGCDGEYMFLRCPAGTTISVQLAQYGKNAVSPATCSTNTNTHPELMDIMDAYSNITCHWPTAIQTVVGLCQKKTSCKFQTSPGTFGGDPCPGSRKYVEIGFKCRPSEFKSVIGCDSEVIQLQCNRSSRLAIYSANYGRTAYEGIKCPQDKGVPEESCLASFATESVMQMCHGKRRCALGVNSATFGEPCKPESTPYLKVIYTCIPRKTLKERYQGELEPDEMYEDETEYESGDPVGGVLEQPSIYSPDHSKGWVNPKSTAKPSYPSKSRSSLSVKYRPRNFPSRQNQYDGSQQRNYSPKSFGSIPHSSNTLTPDINLEETEQSQSSSPSQAISPKARYNLQGAAAQAANNNRAYSSAPISTRGSNVIGGGGVTSLSSSSSSQNFAKSLGANHSQDDLRFIYLIAQGIQAYDFLARNKETLWLYVTLAIASALLVVILVILVKIYVQRHQAVARRRGANANLTAASSSAGPITSTVLSDIDDLSCITDEVTELPSILRNRVSSAAAAGDELDLQTSSTTHLISSSKSVSIANPPQQQSANNSGSDVQNAPSIAGVVTGSPSMLAAGGGFSNSAHHHPTSGSGSSSTVMPGGEGALFLGSECGSVNPSNNSTFIPSGSATMGRKSRQLQHHQQQQQQQQQQMSNHPSSSTFMMTTYGIPMGASTNPGGPQYSQMQHPNMLPQMQQQPQHQHQPMQNPSTMTLGRSNSRHQQHQQQQQQRDPNMHFYYD